MKLSILICLIFFSSSKLNMDSSQFECSLSATVFPLEYHFVTRSMVTRIKLSSNCLRLRDFILESFFTFRNRISKRKHPKVLQLSLLGNRYRLAFSARKVAAQRSILRRFVYRQAKIYPAKVPKSPSVRVDRNNSFALVEKRRGSFNVIALKRLLTARNPIRCGLSRLNTRMSCTIG